MWSPETTGSDAPASIFAALGDPTRLHLVARLSDGSPRSISQLREGSSLSRQGLTKHLRVLEQVGLVHSRRAGREVRFTFVPEPMEEARSYLDRVCQQWDSALNRLKVFVEASSDEA